MRLQAILAGLLMLAVALAGCSDSGSKTNEGEKPPISVGPVEEGKGVIIGVVVDDSIRPIVGATVMVVGHDLTTKTDEAGAFAFKDLEPGSYFVKASKPGYRETQQSVEVVADVKDPKVTRLLLEIDPETTPYFQGPFKWDAYLECTVGAFVDEGNYGSVNCGTDYVVSGESGNTMSYELDGVPTYVQSEIVWTGAGEVGSSLVASHNIPDASHQDGVDDYTQQFGSSPLVLRSNETQFSERGVGTEFPLNIRLFASGQEGDPGSLFLNQEVTVYTTIFYNYQPSEDWLFIEDSDGDPPMPT